MSEHFAGVEHQQAQDVVFLGRAPMAPPPEHARVDCLGVALRLVKHDILASFGSFRATMACAGSRSLRLIA